jgi:hypothetical protein
MKNYRVHSLLALLLALFVFLVTSEQSHAGGVAPDFQSVSPPRSNTLTRLAQDIWRLPGVHVTGKLHAEALANTSPDARFDLVTTGRDVARHGRHSAALLTIRCTGRLLSRFQFLVMNNADLSACSGRASR